MEILRWLGEPIKTLLFHTSVFLTNKKGYPVLSKAHQENNITLNLRSLRTSTNKSKIDINSGCQTFNSFSYFLLDIINLVKY